MTIELKLSNVQDELNLYLTSNRLKPASILNLNVYVEEDALKLREIKENRELISNIEMRINEFFKRYRVNYFKNQAYYFKKLDDATYEKENKTLTYFDKLEIYVGKDDYSLERLLKALLKNKSHESIGMALGYPMNSVKSFSEKINGEVRDWNYFMVSIAKARNSGKEIPKWLAYISFVPKEVDIINNKVSEDARRIGKKYRNFVKKNNPELANGVEEEFLNMKLPDSWEISKEGDYILCYKF